MKCRHASKDSGGHSFYTVSPSYIYKSDPKQTVREKKKP